LATKYGCDVVVLVPQDNAWEQALNTAFFQDMAANLLSAASYAAIAGYAAFAPAGSEEFFRGTLPSPIGLIDANLPNLGDCLLRAVEEICPRPYLSDRPQF
jgi:hypothetical protein